MSKRKKIIISVVAAVFAVLGSVYLFLVPKLIDLNSYKPQIENAVKTETGLNLSIDNIDFRTNLDLSVDVFIKKALLNYPDNKKLLSVDGASVNVSLFPLLFKEVEVKKFKINTPEINILRFKNGKYSIDPILENMKPSGDKQSFKIVKGIGVEIKNYKLNLDDNFYDVPKKFVLAGDLIKISDFNPDKYIKLETKGKLFVQDSPKINFDVKLASELPFQNSESAKPAAADSSSLDPLGGIIRYDFKSNVVADLRLKNVQKNPEMNGFVNFDGLSLKIKDKTLPESYGKIKFKGESLNIDSKLFITPDSYIYVSGDIKDLKKNKLDLSLKTSDINLKDVQNFVEAINDVAKIDVASLKSADISGKIKADVKISGNSDFKGYLYIINTNIAYKGISVPLKNLNSKIDFSGNKMIFTDTFGFIDNNRFDLQGYVDSGNNADLKLNLNRFNIKTVLDVVNQSPMLKDIKPQFKDIDSLSGNINAEAAVKGKLDGKIFPVIKISLVNPSVLHRQAGFPVVFSKGVITADDKKITVNAVQANILQSPVFISGSISDYSGKNLKPDISVSVPLLNLSKIKSLSGISGIDSSTRQLINSIKNPSGLISGNIKVLPDRNIDANINLNKIYAYYAPSNLPVRIDSGVLASDGKRLTVKNVVLKLSNSPLSISGTVASIAKLPEVDLKAGGYIAAADIKKYSPPDVRKSIVTRGNIPVNITAAGYVDGWKLNSETKIDNLSYIASISSPSSKVLNINLKGNPSSISFADSGISSAGQKIVSITGAIGKYSSKTPVLNNVNVSLSNLNLALVEPKGKMKLSGNISLSGSVSRPVATGNITAKSISVPSSFFSSDSINVVLKNNEILVNTGLVNLIDSDMKIGMALENKLSPPFVINNMKITSDYMNADKLQKAFPPVPYQDVPIIVKKGTFYSNKMVLNALKASDTSFDFVINPMNMLKMTNLVTSAAGGKASGKIDMNLKTSKVSVDINTKNMEINTLATAFANTPNEIYGDMNGNIDVTTSGFTPAEQSDNAKGKVIFTVTDGKLTRIGSITHLLKAGNIISGGIGSGMIDNILSFKEAGASNQFKRLVGNISINNGTMTINELSSQGGDMSLYTEGYIQMANNYADLSTFGTLSDRITSRLGRIPDFSVDKLIENKLLKKIPGQWGQVISDFRPKPQYPEIAKIPQLSRGNQETDRHFVVKIQGNFYKPGSVKSFRFID